MYRFRRIVSVTLLGLALAGAGEAVAAPPAESASRSAVVHVASGDDDEASDTTEDSYGTTDSEHQGNGVVMSPARREWLEYVDDADPDTFAGGADLNELVEGSRVIMIGDSVMASTSARYGGEMCDAVTAEGWDVEVNAETGRFIDFGERVLDRRIDDDFDAAVVMLGNNYGADPVVYEDYLSEIVDRLSPRPIVLSTVTEFQSNRAEVNAAIYDVAQDHDNVRVLDWAGATADDATLTAGDGLHLSDRGRARFAELVAAALGDAPGIGAGECLRSSFRDDSAGSGNTGPTEGQVTMPPSTSPSVPEPQPQPQPQPQPTQPQPQPTEPPEPPPPPETPAPPPPPETPAPPPAEQPAPPPPAEPPPPPPPAPPPPDDGGGGGGDTTASP